jgi:hypothetical protein
MPMIPELYSALRGAAGFGCGIAIAWLFMRSEYIFIGVTIGAAFAGASLAWKTRDKSSILLGALGLVLGVWVGGFAILMSSVFLEYHYPYQMPLVDTLGFCCGFTSGFGVIGAGFAAASRLVSLKAGISSFAIGGAAGGAVVVLSGILHVTTGIEALLAVILSFLVAGALCGASIHASEHVSLSILSDKNPELGNRPLS